MERLLLNLDLQGHPLLWEGEGVDVGCVPMWMWDVFPCGCGVCSDMGVGCVPTRVWDVFPCGTCFQWMWDVFP